MVCYNKLVKEISSTELFPNTNLEGCLRKRKTHKRTKIGDSVLLNLFIYSTVVSEVAYVP